MSFWTDNSFEPKQNYKFKVDFITSLNAKFYEVAHIPYYYVASVQKPSFQIQQKKYRYLNTELNYPGLITWNNIDITFIDTADNMVSGFLVGALKLRDFDLEDKTLPLYQNALEKDRLVIDSIIIHQLSSEGYYSKLGKEDPMDDSDSIETWTLQQAWINKISYSDLSTENEELSKITLSLSYDWAYISYPKEIDNNLNKKLKELETEIDSALDLSLDSPSLKYKNGMFQTIVESPTAADISAIAATQNLTLGSSLSAPGKKMVTPIDRSTKTSTPSFTGSPYLGPNPTDKL